jgi:hypothetical protein
MDRSLLRGHSRVALRRGNSCVDFAHAGRCDDMQLPAKCLRRLLRSFPLVGDFRTLRVNYQYNDGDVRYNIAAPLHNPSHSSP